MKHPYFRNATGFNAGLSAYTILVFVQLAPNAFRRLHSRCLRQLFLSALIALISGCTARNANAQIYADSVTDYSGVQGARGWYYGFLAGTLTPADFQTFPLFGNPPQLTAGQMIWYRSSTAYWTLVGPSMMHSNGLYAGRTLEVNWAVRRWISNRSGPAHINLSVEDTSPFCGDGVIASVFINGAQVWQRGVEVLGSVTASFPICLTEGDVIDAVLGPGPIGQDWCDQFNFSIQIYGPVSSGPVAGVVCQSGTATFSVTTFGTGPFTYQWRKGGNFIDQFANPSSSTPNLTLTNIQLSDVGSYGCIVTNACGSVTSNPATLDVASTCCTNSINPNGTYLRTSSDPLAQQPTKINLASCGVGPGDRVRITRLGQYQFAGPTSGLLNAAVGIFSTSDVVLADGSLLNRVPGAIAAGSNGFVTANTSFGDLSTDIDADFFIGETDIVIPAGAQWLIVSPNDQFFGDNLDADGDYQVRIAKMTAPIVTTQPTDASACPGGAAVFTAAAANWGPFAYQWRKDGVAIAAGANASAVTATLTLASVQPADAGVYDCVITNATGSTITDAATLSVPVACSIADLAIDGSCGDGIVDGSDFIAFINSFGAGDALVDPLADVAGGGDDGLLPDGIVDGNDFIAFINAFGAGC